MNRIKRAFTLVELLVVVGIIAILVAILLPALSRARAQANTVYCASNLRQLYQAMQIYATTYNQYVMPAKNATGGDKETSWCGTALLGPLFGLKSGASAADQQAALNRIAKMLDCPAVDRPKNIGGTSTVFTVDYCYNENLGSTKGQYFAGNTDYGTAPPPANKYDPWLRFKRTTQVPASVIIAVDGYDSALNIPGNDIRFIDVGDLCEDHRRIGWPHQKRANFLFNDGTVHILNPWDKNVRNPYTLPLASPDLKRNPLLNNNLILAQQALSVSGTKYTTNDVWAKGREAPF